MPVALLADAHLGGPGGPAGPLVDQLRALPETGCQRLVILGDLFQAWVGDRRFETAEIRAVVPALRELRERGVAVDYVEGNRDFFLGGSPYAELFGRVGSEVAFAARGRRYLAVHGDGLDPRDRMYLFWRWLSKNRASRLIARRLPRALARRIVDTTERRLARTNFKHKVQIPEEVIRAYARRRLAEGHDVLCLGHYHEERRWSVEGGEVWLLAAWFRSRRIEWVRDGEAISQ